MRTSKFYFYQVIERNKKKFTSLRIFPLVSRPDVYLENQPYVAPVQCWSVLLSCGKHKTRKGREKAFILCMAPHETSHCCPSPLGSYGSGGNRVLLPFLGQREFPWEKTLGSLWVSGHFPKALAKRLLEARIALAQEQIALQRRTEMRIVPISIKKKRGGEI